MKLQLNEENYITGFTVFSNIYEEISGIEVPEAYFDGCDLKRINCYYVEGTKHAVLDEGKYDCIQMEELTEDIRMRREIECFAYINRGQLWYEKYVDTEEKRQQLDDFYAAFLTGPESVYKDTETGVWTWNEPVRPNWLL